MFYKLRGIASSAMLKVPPRHLRLLLALLASASCAAADAEQGAGRVQVRPSLECRCSGARGEEKKLFDFGCKHVASQQSTETIFSCDMADKSAANTTKSAAKYNLHTDRLPWDEARSVCHEEGGDLAVVHSAADARIMEEIFRQNPNIHEEEWINNQAWMGVTDRATEGVFLTVSGESLKAAGWEKWAQYEPNDGLGGEDCVTFTREGTLNDMKCTHHLPFFCESRAGV